MLVFSGIFEIEGWSGVCCIPRVKCISKKPNIPTVPHPKRRTTINQKKAPLTMRKSNTSAGTFSIRRSKKAVAMDSPSTTVRVRGRSSLTDVATNDNAVSRMPADESALRYLSSWERDASGHLAGGSLRRNEVTLETSLNVTFIQWGNAIMEENLESDLREMKQKE